jgi:twitching motility protein PilT
MGEYDSELSKIVAELNRAAPSQKPASTRGSQATPTLDKLLNLAAARNASDILLVAGAPAMLRVTGNLTPASGPPLDAEEVRSLVTPLLEPAQLDELQRIKSLDFGFFRDGIGRFRVNVHHQRGTLAACIRLLPSKIPSLESLHLPSSLAKLAERRQGLVLLTGPTGCGKSSTLAALIDIVNTRRAAHVVTIEDPVEYQHANRSAVIEQIEVGRDTPDFAVTLRSIMRQSPDVILVGEMRDAETISTALTAAETGHLVLSTLHTNDTIQSVSRILDTFPSSNQPQIRQQLSLPRWRHALARHRNHALHRRRPRPHPQRGRPPAPLAGFRGQIRGHDDHGAIARRACTFQPHHARHGLRALLPRRRSPAVLRVGNFKPSSPPCKPVSAHPPSWPSPA